MQTHLFFIISVPPVCVHGGVLICEAAVDGSSRQYSVFFCLTAPHMRDLAEPCCDVPGALCGEYKKRLA